MFIVIINTNTLYAEKKLCIALDLSINDA